jgi:adenylate kinase family enzyme
MKSLSDNLSKRLLIIGNSGSGKSTLAGAVGSRTSQPVFDLDAIHWQDHGHKRDEAIARNMVAEIAAQPHWIMEGVYGWLAEAALPRATALIWTDLPWPECRAGLLGRGPRNGMSEVDQVKLLAWAEEYWTRTTSSSVSGHQRIFDSFAGDKLKVTSRHEADRFMDDVCQQNSN